MADPHSVAMNAAGRPVVLVGLPGVGKTRVGRLLAQRINWAFADIDREVEQASGQSVPELVAERGWACFRDLEQETLAQCLGRSNTVIATGGGAVERVGNRNAIMRHGCTVWLQADQALLLQRLRDAEIERPLLAGDAGQRLEELARNREPLYAEVAIHRFDTGAMTPEAIAERLIAIIGLEQTRAL